ncbi:MAG: maleylpyruvate isomerase family mycothiol-dependent enzyme [Nocardiopsaceae bacterium]|nr:maleylpyruvate isomerase family mycothiol-dependent enzyme [Nocardiopsaceae bacterium]
MADLSDLAAGERRDLADYLDTLTAEEWERPSLCRGWSVRDVAGHVSSYDVLSWPALMALFARSGFSLDRANQARLAESRRLRADELTARLRECAVPRGVTTLFGCAVALTDGLVHHQDIRRALGHPRQVPPERLAAALEFAPRARALPAPANLRGIRVIATDLDWSHGTGPEVRGPAEALLVALAGRPQALADLEGSGLGTLEARLRR